MERYWNAKCNFNATIPKFSQKFIKESPMHAIHFTSSKKWLHKCYKNGRVKSTTNYLQERSTVHASNFHQMGNLLVILVVIQRQESTTRRNCCDYEDETSCSDVVAMYLWKCRDFALKKKK